MSLINLQKAAILDKIHHVGPDKWRYVITDAQTMRLITNVLDIDKILSQKVSGVDQIENRRVPHPEFEAVYILSPKQHIIDCLISDFKRPRPRYGGAYLLWTSHVPDSLKSLLYRALNESNRGNWILGEETLAIDFFPRESHLFTFREPQSFFPLYHPGCDDLCQREFREIAKKILGVCVTLGEFPIIRFFRSPHLNHRARQLPQMIANAVQRELEGFQDDMEKRGIAWPTEEKSRPRAVLFIVDRSMDPFAPLLHEFTYQAMAHDLRPIKDGEKVIYTIESATPNGPEMKDMPIHEEDKLWLNVRHKHMKDAIEILKDELAKFRKEHPEFDKGDASTVFALKTMFASLPQFVEQKDSHELHLVMSGECMQIFQQNRLPETADLEQIMSTGLEIDGTKPKGVTDQLIRLLASPNTMEYNDRLRLILVYLLWRDGLIGTDIDKLFRHAEISKRLRNALYNLDLLGVRTVKLPKDTHRPGYRKPSARPPIVPEGYELSRYVPVVKQMLEDFTRGTLDNDTFPTTDSLNTPAQQLSSAEAQAATQASLRSATARAKWTSSTRTAAGENRQRIIVFVAGGATYSEVRSCYEISQSAGRDVYLGSSHMLTPDSFLDQMVMARADRRELGLEVDLPPEQRPTAPAYLFEPDPVPNQPRPAATAASPAVKPVQVQQAPPPPVQKNEHQPGQFNPNLVEKKKKKKLFGF